MHIKPELIKPGCIALYCQVTYKIGEDLDLATHIDSSDITINVCLGKEFTGQSQSCTCDSLFPLQRRVVLCYHRRLSLLPQSEGHQGRRAGPVRVSSQGGFALCRDGQSGVLALFAHCRSSAPSASSTGSTSAASLSWCDLLGARCPRLVAAADCEVCLLHFSTWAGTFTAPTSCSAASAATSLFGKLPGVSLAAEFLMPRPCRFKSRASAFKAAQSAAEGTVASEGGSSSEGKGDAKSSAGGGGEQKADKKQRLKVVASSVDLDGRDWLY